MRQLTGNAITTHTGYRKFPRNPSLKPYATSFLNHMRLHTRIYEGVKVLCSHGTREETQRTAFERQVEDRARRVRRVANWMFETVERRSSCVADRGVRAELATSPPNHTGASSPRARAKSRPGGVNEEEPCYSQSAVRLRVRHLVAVALSYPLRSGPRDFPLVCHVCLCA